MKPIVEKLSPLAAAEPVVCEVVRGHDFGCVWHYHTECEITLVVKGGTERLVGNNISPLLPGDLILLGSNVPHDYRNQRAAGEAPTDVEAIVVQFMPELPGHEDWLQRSTMKPIRRLFQRAEQGVEVTGITRLTATRMVKEMLHVNGMKRVILLLQLLDLLSNSEELKEISSPVLPFSRVFVTRLSEAIVLDRCEPSFSGRGARVLTVTIYCRTLDNKERGDPSDKKPLPVLDNTMRFLARAASCELRLPIFPVASRMAATSSSLKFSVGRESSFGAFSFLVGFLVSHSLFSAKLKNERIVVSSFRELRALSVRAGTSPANPFFVSLPRWKNRRPLLR